MNLPITKAIITALGLEGALIIKKYNLTMTKEMGSMKLYEGKIVRENKEEENLVLLICGEGKIQSTMATTYLCENFIIEKIINIGIVGNLNYADIKIGDVLLPNTFVQHDFYMPEAIDFHKHLREPIFLEYAIGTEYDLEKFSLHLHGICATGDQFIDNTDLQAEIAETYGADIVDMEAYAIVSVLKNYNLLDKTIVIKSVSDGADSGAEKNAMGNLQMAMENAVIILDFII